MSEDFQNAELREMTGDEAKNILSKLLKDLQTIDWEDLTTIERNLVRKISKHPIEKV